MKRISHGFLICKHRLIQEDSTANFIPMPLTAFYPLICLSATAFDCFFSQSEMLGGSWFNQFLITASLCHPHHHFICFQDQRSLLTLYLRICYNMIKEVGSNYTGNENQESLYFCPGKDHKLQCHSGSLFHGIIVITLMITHLTFCVKDAFIFVIENMNVQSTWASNCKQMQMLWLNTGRRFPMKVDKYALT